MRVGSPARSFPHEISHQPHHPLHLQPAAAVFGANAAPVALQRPVPDGGAIRHSHPRHPARPARRPGQPGAQFQPGSPRRRGIETHHRAGPRPGQHPWQRRICRHRSPAAAFFLRSTPLAEPQPRMALWALQTMPTLVAARVPGPQTAVADKVQHRTGAWAWKPPRSKRLTGGVNSYGQNSSRLKQ
jgi:hypothetical protein